MSITYITARPPEGVKKTPRWMRTLAVDDDTGTILVPAAAADPNEDRVFYCAAFDSIPVLTYLGHLYVSLDWAEKEYPDGRELWEAMRRGAQQAAPDLVAEPDRGDVDRGDRR